MHDLHLTHAETDMLNIILRNVEDAEQATQLVHELFEPLVRRFPDLREHRITVVLEEDPAPRGRHGSRSLSVKATVDGSRYRAMTLARMTDSLHAAIADVVARLRTMLNHAASKARRRSPQPFRPLLPSAA
jgi:ribosome-associated translation inhibitor RaiA